MVNPNGGSVAFVGNTRYGWYQIGNPSALSGYYDRLFYQSFFSEHRTVLGDCFTDHKNSYYPGGDPYFQYVFTELTLLGDQELHMWTENPEAMVVTHPATLPLGTSSFTVHVEKTNGVDISGALVVLWKGTEVYLSGTTNANGDVTLTPSPLTAGTMLVTVTKQNYIPYEGASDVEELTIDPEQSTVVLSSENMPGMITCPAGDGAAYEHLLVTLRNSGGNPVPDVPANHFIISVAPQPGTQHYSTLSCTFTPVDAQTNANGEIRFTVRGDTSIIGDIQVSVTVQEILLNDQPLLSCKSFDVDVTGTVSGTDFVIFGQQWGSTEWDCDFTWDGVVGGSDFVMFGQHWGHHV